MGAHPDVSIGTAARLAGRRAPCTQTFGRESAAHAATRHERAAMTQVVSPGLSRHNNKAHARRRTCEAMPTATTRTQAMPVHALETHNSRAFSVRVHDTHPLRLSSVSTLQPIKGQFALKHTNLKNKKKCRAKRQSWAFIMGA